VSAESGLCLDDSCILKYIKRFKELFSCSDMSINHIAGWKNIRRFISQEEKKNLESNLKLNWECWNCQRKKSIGEIDYEKLKEEKQLTPKICDFEGKLEDFYLTIYRQGNDLYYLTIRCPGNFEGGCGHLQGRILAFFKYDSFTLKDALSGKTEEKERKEAEKKQKYWPSKNY
jgi:hypothetical protein